MTPQSGTDAARRAQNSTAFRTLARGGFVVIGVLHILIGFLAISIATGGSDEGDADQSGAVQQIREVPFGEVVLWVLAAGLIALAVWQLTATFLEGDDDPKKKWAKRVKDVGSAIAYAAIAVTIIASAMGQSSDSSESTQSLSARILAVPAGVVLLVVVGLVTIGVGIGFAVQAFTRGFLKTVALPGGTVRTVMTALGVAGYLAKGIAVAVVGILFVVAAVTYDPETAGGLDAALRSLTDLPFGVVILWAVGLGLCLYGAFSIARARYAKM